MTDMKSHLAKQEADRLAGEAIARASQAVNASRVVQRSVCLVPSYRPRDDVPEGTLLVGMTPNVVAILATMGLKEPVCLSLLPGMWWAANVDKSSLDSMIESGAGFSAVVTSSEEVMTHYAFAYCQMTDGPYLSREEASMPQ
jgi:hypothetical protein